MSGTRAKSVIWMEKLIYGHIAIKITLGEAVVRGDLSAPKYVTDICTKKLWKWKTILLLKLDRKAQS